MTKEQELDIFCAEKVMGWKLHRSGRGSMVATADMNLNGEREHIVVSGHPWDDVDFSPTSRPGDAMMVLEKCAGDCSVVIRKQFSGKWCVWDANGNDDFEGFEDTLPLAICQFAKQLYGGNPA